MVRNLCILGSTGSIGRQSLEVAAHLGIPVSVLAAGTKIDLLAEQCRIFRPKLAVTATQEGADALSQALSGQPIQIAWGEAGLLEAAAFPETDCVITAVVGMLGLKPTLAAIAAKKRIGLANKETLVCAGELVMAAAARYGAQIIPVDSEHSAIFQCLMGCSDRREVEKLLLTCSGGPFFGRSRRELETVTSRDALRHPNWRMGPKITVDCATLMNKGMEVIEAMRLYGLPQDRVEVLIHRQSIVHSLVSFRDGAVLAQLGTPDMRLPIQLAMTYPERVESLAPPLDLTACGPLTFEKPDLETFPCLALALACAQAGGTACAAMNGANEAAVSLFLKDQIGFYDIYRRVSQAVEAVPYVQQPDLDQILEADRLARALAGKL